MVAAAVLLAACSGVGADVPEPSSTPTATSTSSTSPSDVADEHRQPVGYMPLTGVGVSSTAALTRPAVVVAVQLVHGRPVSGIGSADLVYAEFDRSRHVRLVAVYQSADAGSVGPVTATAPADPKLLTLFGSPAYGFDGGPTGFVAQAKAPR